MPDWSLRTYAKVPDPEVEKAKEFLRNNPQLTTSDLMSMNARKNLDMFAEGFGKHVKTVPAITQPSPDDLSKNLMGPDLTKPAEAPAPMIRAEVAEAAKKIAGEEPPALPAAADEAAAAPEAKKEKTLGELMAERDEKVNKAKRTEDIGKNLDLLGRSIAGLRGGVNTRKLQKFDTSRLEENVREEEDKLRPQDISLLKKYGIDFPGIEDARYSSTMKLLPFLENNRVDEANAKVRADNTSKAVEDRETNKQNAALQTAIAKERGERVKPTSRLGKLKDAVAATERVNDLLTKNNPVATRAAMVEIAKKLAGDTGVLTQQDIDAYEGSIGIPGFFTNLQKQIQGDFTPTQKARLREVAKVMGSQAKQHFQTEEKALDDSFAETWAPHLERKGIDRGALSKMLGSSGNGGAASAPTYAPGSKIVGPDGQTYTVKKVNPDGTIETE